MFGLNFLVLFSYLYDICKVQRKRWTRLWQVNLQTEFRRLSRKIIMNFHITLQIGREIKALTYSFVLMKSFEHFRAIVCHFSVIA